MEPEKIQGLTNMPISIIQKIPYAAPRSGSPLKNDVPIC